MNLPRQKNQGELGEKDWHFPPRKLELLEHQVHVWRAALDAPPSQFEELRGFLSKDEQKRAQGYRFERDRRWFIIRRGMLRRLLERYLGIPAAQIEFDYNPYGKPELGQRSKSGSLHFTLSHSKGLVLFAFARQLNVGVDIERLRSDFEMQRLAERFFSPHENSELNSLSQEERPAAFFACWTRKEAFIKAHGEGLSLPLHQFDVSLKPGEEAQLLATREGLEPAENWVLRHLEPGWDAIAALAVSGHGWVLIRLQCEG
jgi:4'-phosphopantetheinyl transferase